MLLTPERFSAGLVCRRRLLARAPELSYSEQFHRQRSAELRAFAFASLARSVRAPSYTFIVDDRSRDTTPGDELRAPLTAEDLIAEALIAEDLPAGPDQSESPYYDLSDYLGSEDVRSAGALVGLTLLSGAIASRIDLLIRSGSEWDLVVVAGGTGIKPSYLERALLQQVLLARAGMPVRQVFVWHPRKEYQRSGALDPEAYFRKSNVTRRLVTQHAPERAQLTDMERLITSGSIDPRELPPCARPDTCPVCSEIEGGGTQEVFSLFGGKSLARDLVAQGIHKLSDIPESQELSRPQRIQRNLAREGGVHLEAEKLAAFLTAIVFPRVFLDFEAFSRPLPPFEGVRPWEFVPTQFSLQVQQSPGSGMAVHDYIMPPGEDTREELLDQLLLFAGKPGSVIVYGAQFERSVLAGLARLQPERAAELALLSSRIVDLLELFKGFHYYNPGQGGRVSLKRVLPALTGEDYGDLAVQDGLEASILYQRLAFDDREGFSADGKEKARESLVRYCRQDTQAMVRIVEELERLRTARAGASP